MPLGHNELNDIEGVDLLHNLTKHHVQVAIEELLYWQSIIIFKSLCVIYKLI